MSEHEDMSVRRKLRELIMEVARENGLSQPKALELAADLTITFLDAITTSPRFRGLNEEWMRDAASAKRPPTCKAPCVFSDHLEYLLRSKYGFGDSHFLIALRKLSKLR